MYIYKMCNFTGCKKLSMYNFDGNKAKYCSIHKENGMINVHHKKCCFNECKKMPLFNYEGLKEKLYCAEHKKDEMINISDKRCIFEGCNKQSTFNYEGLKERLYCFQHKKDGMVSVKEKKKCIYENCKKIPCYNYIGENNAIYCAEHKKNEMIDICHKKCCYENCQYIPTYNFEGETKPIYCSIHKKDNMINVKHKKCNNNWCYTIASNSKYEGYCFYCYLNMFPDKQISKNYKTKEYAVVEYIKKIFPNYTWCNDKIIQDGCSKKRPDMLVDLGYQIIIIEIDENQHSDYDCSCEHKRIMEISQDLQHRPIIFIRFNPDDYNKKNEKISSCWGINGNGISVVKKTKLKEWNERLSILSSHVEYWLDPKNVTNKTIEIIQLFYNE